jgi:hypothetical protein
MIRPDPHAFLAHDFNDIRKLLDEPQLGFPKPRDLCVNMMPIGMSEEHWVGRDNATVPPELKGYLDLIHYCCLTQAFGNGDHDVAYLTVHESWVAPGASQRRPGVHIERPCGGRVVGDDEDAWYDLKWGAGQWLKSRNTAGATVTYEDGCAFEGLFMASSVGGMGRIWPCLIDEPARVTDRHGGLEHLRDQLGEPGPMLAETLYWLTDRTPHESLPNLSDAPVYRQFFRLVVGPIDRWFSRHNTPNPFGLRPAAEISDEDKFGEAQGGSTGE